METPGGYFFCNEPNWPQLWQWTLVSLLELQGAAAAASYEVLIGNREWMQRNGLEVKGDVHKAMEEQEVQGQTAVLCVIDGG